jgi:hypothetical protein
LPFEKQKKANFNKLFNEILEKAKYDEIKRHELERLKEKALRTKIRLEVEQGLKDQFRKELGLRGSSEERMIPEHVKFEVEHKNCSRDYVVAHLREAHAATGEGGLQRKHDH